MIHPFLAIATAKKFILNCVPQRQIFLWGIFLCLVAGLFACAAVPPTRATILNTRSREEQPALNGNGRWLAFVSNRNGYCQILLYNLQTKQEVNSGLEQKAIYESPSLSRTGRYIVYLSSQRGRPEIFLYDRATKRTEVLSQGYRSLLRNPHISPDGRYIVFETARRGQWDIEMLDRGPNVEQDITDGSPVVSP